eukprot:jgi/Chrpa1/25042/Chrysochromulina_OHIO_Genome00000221-RA
MDDTPFGQGGEGRIRLREILVAPLGRDLCGEVGDAHCLAKRGEIALGLRRLLLMPMARLLQLLRMQCDPRLLLVLDEAHMLLQRLEPSVQPRALFLPTVLRVPPLVLMRRLRLLDAPEQPLLLVCACLLVHLKQVIVQLLRLERCPERRVLLLDGVHPCIGVPTLGDHSGLGRSELHLERAHATRRHLVPLALGEHLALAQGRLRLRRSPQPFHLGMRLAHPLAELAPRLVGLVALRGAYLGQLRGERVRVCTHPRELSRMLRELLMVDLIRLLAQPTSVVQLDAGEALFRHPPLPAVPREVEQPAAPHRLASLCQALADRLVALRELDAACARRRELARSLVLLRQMTLLEQHQRFGKESALELHLLDRPALAFGQPLERLCAGRALDLDLALEIDEPLARVSHRARLGLLDRRPTQLLQLLIRLEKRLDPPVQKVQLCLRLLAGDRDRFALVPGRQRLLARESRQELAVHRLVGDEDTQVEREPLVAVEGVELRRPE